MRRSPYTLPLLLAFWPITALVLYSDSMAVARSIPCSQWLSDFIALIYLTALIGCMNPRRRLLAIIFVPLSAIGEAVFTILLGLYGYRLGMIPLYVPLGHSILLAVGLGYSELPLLRLYHRWARQGLALFHGLLVGGCLLLFGDTLSAIWGCIFFAMFPWLRKRVAYLTVGVLVLYIELLGTAWGCWTWHPAPFGVLRTTNPPTGAFCCYVIAELLAVQIAALLAGWWCRRTITTPVVIRPAEG